MSNIQVRADAVKAGDHINTGQFVRIVSRVEVRKDGKLEFYSQGMAHPYEGNLGLGIDPEWVFDVWRHGA